MRHACAAVARQLDRDGAELDWAEVFEHAGWALVEEQRRYAADPTAGPEQAAASLATTLVVAAVTAHGDGGWRAQAAAVGDSPALLHENGEFEAVVGEGGSTDGLVGGGVAALPRHSREVRSDERTFGAGAVLLVCTDGLALPLGDGNGEVGRMLTRELARPPEIVDFARLLDFSRSTYDDDRTLVAVWARGEP